MKSGKFLAVLLLTALVFLLSECRYIAPKVDYNTDVKPILNRSCISCHGGVKQSAGFSLLFRDLALADTESGGPAIIPGDAGGSEFIKRLSMADPDERMPLDGEPLSKKEISILRKWVNQGAEWGQHWAYRPLFNEEQVLNMGVSTKASFIDEQVAKKLRQEGLSPSERAEKSDLLRRLSMDIIGMPAPDNIRRKFLNGEIKYEIIVDSLLSLPSFGEKWASMWLDVARYADSKGFEKDRSRNIWRYRDYVIKAFNQDMPYDQFVVEQLAGDMLDSPSTEQLIATGFHRNTATNDEGGTDNEEYRVKAVVDRVSTTWEGMLGTTMACVQCHAHPYDPFKHSDFYESYAVFNNTRDSDTPDDYPVLNFLDSLSQEKLDELTTWIAKVEDGERAEEVDNFVHITQPIIYSLETDMHVNAALYDTKFLGMRGSSSARIPDVDLSGKTALWISYSMGEDGGTLEILKDSRSGESLALHTFGKKRSGMLEIILEPSQGRHDIFLKYDNPRLNNAEARGLILDWFHFTEAFPGAEGKERQAWWKSLQELLGYKHPSTLVMHENPEEMQRKSYIFDRGNWQVHTTEVSPGTPSVLPAMKPELSKDRLGFAQWVASKENPLTARTYVNRIWEQLFGRGIVRTVEDLGSQGSLPSHPALLDRLAYEFSYEDAWSTKSLIRKIVLSETYQQSSITTAEKLEEDPYNELLSRGPRNRLTAEQVRDQALFLSKRLSPKMYGPPVKPHQPDGIWNSPYSNEEWNISEGEDRFRRAIYTMIKRTAIYPSMETFDMASRQVCASRRINSNTPLQALVTLNDPVYTELSHAIGNLILSHNGDISDGIKHVYTRAMNKDIHPAKLRLLLDLYEDTLNEATSNPEATARMTVANSIINLDDLLNK